MRLWLPAIGLIVALVLPSAQQAPPPTQAPTLVFPNSGVPPGGTGTIVGRVVEGDTTTGLSDAVVSLTGPLSPSGAAGLNGAPRRVITTREGRFLFRELPKGVYTVAVSAAGFTTGVYGRGRPTLSARGEGLVVVVVDDSEIADAQVIRLWKRGGIGGTVVDEIGEPVVGVVVTAVPQVRDPAVSAHASATTDDRGNYHMDVVPGEFVVGIYLNTTTVPVPAIDLWAQSLRDGPTSDAGRAMRSVRLSAAPDLSRVNGLRYDGFLLSANRLNNVMPSIDKDGRLSLYATTVYPSGASATAASIISVGSGEEKAGINLQMRPVVTTRVTGQVVGPSGPIPYIGVRLMPVNPLGDRLRSGGSSAQGMTDGAGRFTLLGVIPGSYVLGAIRFSSPGAGLLTGNAPVTVNENAADDITLTLAGGGVWSGRIVVEGTTPIPPAVLRAIRITPTLTADTPQPMIMTDTSSRVNDAGFFSSPELLPGAYTLWVNGLPPTWAVVTAISDGRDVLDIPVEIRPGAAHDVVVTLTDRVTSLAGTVRGADGRAEANVWVTVFPTDQKLWRRPGPRSRNSRTQPVPTDREGRYAFRGLPPGEYFVVATAEEFDTSDARLMAALAAGAPRVTLAIGDSKTADIRRATVR